MIFVSVGTHEDQFDRLVKEVDRLKGLNSFEDEVFIQWGYCTFIPEFCDYSKLLGYDQMDKYIRNARIVITHGGPGSIIHPLKYGKKPIVVPRQKQFNEHVDNHQVLFTKRLASESKVLPVYDIADLECLIRDYEEALFTGHSNNSNLNKFVEELDRIARELLKES